MPPAVGGEAVTTAHGVAVATLAVDLVAGGQGAEQVGGGATADGEDAGDGQQGEAKQSKPW